jgi:hypothetical protein
MRKVVISWIRTIRGSPVIVSTDLYGDIHSLRFLISWFDTFHDIHEN